MKQCQSFTGRKGFFMKNKSEWRTNIFLRQFFLLFPNFQLLPYNLLLKHVKQYKRIKNEKTLVYFMR